MSDFICGFFEAGIDSLLIDDFFVSQSPICLNRVSKDFICNIPSYLMNNETVFFTISSDCEREDAGDLLELKHCLVEIEREVCVKINLIGIINLIDTLSKMFNSLSINAMSVALTDSCEINTIKNILLSEMEESLIHDFIENEGASNTLYVITVEN